MKKYAFLFVLPLLLLANSKTYCQGNDEIIRFTAAPLNLFDPVTGVLQVGLQKNFGRKVALSLDHGFKMNRFRYAGTGQDRKDYKYSKSKAELKYFMYLKGRDSLINVPYLAIEGLYFPQKYYKEHDWVFRNHDSFMYERSDIKRTVWVTSLKLGVEHRFGNVILDQYIGAGIRRMEIRHQTTGETEASYYGPADIHFPPVDQNEGIIFRPHISFGLKVGYAIKKRASAQ